MAGRRHSEEVGRRMARGSILVVDDGPAITEVVSRYLERAGYETHVVGDGRAALTVAARDAPDLVVLELTLPGMDGLEVIRRLRESPGPTPAIIVLTARGEASDRIAGLSLGADDYVVKPFSPAELVARVEAVLRRTATVRDAEPQILAGGLDIDVAGRIVRHRGGEVALTQREFDLLVFLARHPGRAFTREELMRHVWRLSFYTDTATVTVHIRRLRTKLGSAVGGDALIETVWGIGYRFAPASEDAAA